MPPIAILVALADPTRCRIIEILRDGPQPVHILAGAFDISRPAISRHLRVLKDARLISEKKIGRENRYGLHATRLKPVRTWIDGLVPDADAKSPVKKELVDTAIASPGPLAAEPVMAIPAAPPTTRVKASALPPLSQIGFDF